MIQLSFSKGEMNYKKVEALKLVSDKMIHIIPQPLLLWNECIFKTGLLTAPTHQGSDWRPFIIIVFIFHIFSSSFCLSWFYISALLAVPSHQGAVSCPLSIILYFYPGRLSLPIIAVLFMLWLFGYSSSVIACPYWYCLSRFLVRGALLAMAFFAALGISVVIFWGCLCTHPFNFMCWYNYPRIGWGCSWIPLLEYGFC